MKKILYLLVPVFLFSCVSKSDYAKLEKEHEKLKSDYDELEKEYEELKSNIDLIIEDNRSVQKFFEENNLN